MLNTVGVSHPDHLRLPSGSTYNRRRGHNLQESSPLVSVQPSRTAGADALGVHWDGRRRDENAAGQAGACGGGSYRSARRGGVLEQCRLL
jgi:hypothetical protein